MLGDLQGHQGLWGPPRTSGQPGILGSLETPRDIKNPWTLGLETSRAIMVFGDPQGHQDSQGPQGPWRPPGTLRPLGHRGPWGTPGPSESLGTFQGHREPRAIRVLGGLQGHRDPWDTRMLADLEGQQGPWGPPRTSRPLGLCGSRGPSRDIETPGPSEFLGTPRRLRPLEHRGPWGPPGTPGTPGHPDSWGPHGARTTSPSPPGRRGGLRRARGSGGGAHLDVLGQAVEDLLGHGHGLGEVALPLLVDHVLPRVVPVEVADGLLPPDGHCQPGGTGTRGPPAARGHGDHQQHGDMGTKGHGDHQQHRAMGLWGWGPPAAWGHGDGDHQQHGDTGTNSSMTAWGHRDGDHQQYDGMGMW